MWTQIYLFGQGTLNHLTYLAKFLSRGCDYLPVWCIWLYDLIMSYTRFRVNLLLLIAFM